MEAFLKIVTKADNVPILAMVLIVGYMTWWMVREGLKNDSLTVQGQSEKIYDRMNRWIWGEKEEEGD